jgi:predicted RNA binding protein YcfA (HicA-like mRNA interferase family)
LFGIGAGGADELPGSSDFSEGLKPSQPLLEAVPTDENLGHHSQPLIRQVGSRSQVVNRTGADSRRITGALTQPSVRFYHDAVTWAEVIRELRAAGFVEVRSGKGRLKHPTTGKEVWVAVHTRKDAGRLGNRIMREAGVK